MTANLWMFVENHLELTAFQYDCISFALVFLGRFLRDDISNVHGFFHALLSSIIFCLCTRALWRFSSNEAQDLHTNSRQRPRQAAPMAAPAASASMRVNGGVWTMLDCHASFDGISDYATRYSSQFTRSPKCKQLCYFFSWFCIVLFTATFLSLSPK